MKETTKKRKKARFGIEAAYGRQWIDASDVPYIGNRQTRL